MEAVAVIQMMIITMMIFLMEMMVEPVRVMIFWELTVKSKKTLLPIAPVETAKTVMAMESLPLSWMLRAPPILAIKMIPMFAIKE